VILNIALTCCPFALVIYANLFANGLCMDTVSFFAMDLEMQGIHGRHNFGSDARSLSGSDLFRDVRVFVLFCRSPSFFVVSVA
jgi:hypothetical protein